MAYCDQADIIALIGETALMQLTDDDGAGVIDSARVTRAIADADAAVDSYCQGLYTTPLSPVPAMITRIACDIAAYNLYSRRDMPMPDIRKDRNTAAIRFLELVAAGKVSLGADTPAPSDTQHSVDFNSSARKFTRGKLRDF